MEFGKLVVICLHLPSFFGSCATYLQMKQQQYMKIQHENTILLNKIGRYWAITFCGSTSLSIPSNAHGHHRTAPPRIMAHGDELLDHRETVCRAKNDNIMMNLWLLSLCSIFIHFLHLQTQKYSKSMNIRPRKDEFAKINAQNIVRIPDSFCEPIIQLTPICRAISGYFVQYFDWFCVTNKTQAMLQRLKETRAHVNVDDLENTFLKGTLVYSGIVNK